MRGKAWFFAVPLDTSCTCDGRDAGLYLHDCKIRYGPNMYPINMITIKKN
jgi:hypothetical protein